MCDARSTRLDTRVMAAKLNNPRRCARNKTVVQETARSRAHTHTRTGCMRARKGEKFLVSKYILITIN